MNKQIETIFQAINKMNGQAYFVGGYVRDYLLNRQVNDYDIEVYGLSFESLKKLLESFGEVKAIGKAFGILRMPSLNADFALPRKEITYGFFHTDVKVILDPSMSLKEASSRRDFTINAMMFDPLSKIIYDFFDGQKDLEAKCLRMVDPQHFSEDVLRCLRAAQFLARYDLSINSDTLNECIKMSKQLKYLPKERIYMEMSKMLEAPYLLNGLAYLNRLFENSSGIYIQPLQFKQIQVIYNLLIDLSLIDRCMIILYPLSESQRTFFLDFFIESKKEKAKVKKSIELIDYWSYQNDISQIECIYTSYVYFANLEDLVHLYQMYFNIYKALKKPLNGNVEQIIIQLKSFNDRLVDGHMLLKWFPNLKGRDIKDYLMSCFYLQIVKKMNQDEIFQWLEVMILT